VKVYGTVFLGAARSNHSERAHEQPSTMTAPMLVLAVCCAFIGLVPLAIAPVLDHATLAWAPESMGFEPSIATRAPLIALSAGGAGLLVITALGALVVARLAHPTHAVTWDCGYAVPSARMQYTSSSFAQSLVRWFAWALRPHVERVALQAPFPASSHFHSDVQDTILERGVLPTLQRAARFLRWFRWVQRGKVHLYILYIVVALLVTLLFRR
jgi:NADH:ubiquinone oxidoreductase subunit 5 (subunit L)/multisubunit Na+/H+ antiporter MnhA subunit